MTIQMVKISSISTEKGLVGGPFGSSLVNKDYRDSGVPIIRGTNLNSGRNVNGDFVFVSENKFQDDLQRNSALPNDIVFTQRGTLGQVAIVPDGPFPVYVVSQSQMRLRVDPQIADTRYVYYACGSDTFKRQISDHAIATGVPHINLGILGRLEVPLPPLHVQMAISEVLGALDDKIAANEDILRITENLLHASYRGFINDTTRQQVKVRDIVRRMSPIRKFKKDDLVAQGDFPVFDQSEIGLLGYLNGDGFLEATTEDPILYFGDHTCKLRIATQPFTVGPNTVPFIGTRIPALTLYCALNGVQKQEEYKRHWSLLMDKEIFVPNDKECEKFASHHGRLLTIARVLAKENRSLATTRDALLPRLMSGELRVKDAEALVEPMV